MKRIKQKRNIELRTWLAPTFFRYTRYEGIFEIDIVYFENIFIITLYEIIAIT